MEINNLEQCCGDATSTIEDVLDRFKRKQDHEMNEGKRTFSQYHHLFPILKKSDAKCQAYTRMTLTTFNYILSKVSPVLNKNWCNLHRQPIRPEEKLVVTIRYLATRQSYSDLEFSFLMGKSTAFYLIKDVLNALWNEIWPLHIPIPTEDKFFDIAQEFYLLCDLPHCVDSIDVKHVRIIKPPNSGKRYYNYKHSYSITLQTVVDARQRFIAIVVGGYGHQHDATTFRNSLLFKGLKTNQLKLPEDDEPYKSRTVLPYFFVGDGAYPLSKNLMKSFPGLGLSAEKKLFNKRLSRGRVMVECAFGRLSKKWRIFHKAIKCMPEKVNLIVKVACILINVIKELEKPKTMVSRLLNSKSFPVFEQDERECELLSGDGNIIRTKLMEFFSQNAMQTY